MKYLFFLIIFYVVSIVAAFFGGYQFHAYKYVYKQEADAKAFFDIGTNETEPVKSLFPKKKIEK